MSIDPNWPTGSGPIVFLRPIGIAAADALRLMEAAKRMTSHVRWRMAPTGVAADAYLVHRHGIVPIEGNPLSDSPLWGSSTAYMGGKSAPQSVNVGISLASSTAVLSHKLSLDEHGWHRGRPVCILGQNVETSGLAEDQLAPLHFPEALKDLQLGLDKLTVDLTGIRMLYLVGQLAMQERSRWHTHHLQATEANQLIAVFEPQAWRFHLRDGCPVERLESATLSPMPKTGKFAAEGFHEFALELALWEFAKRCPEETLAQMIPDSYLVEPLTHRRLPRLKEHALGEHCVAILRALDTHPRSLNELQISLRLSRPALLRAVTCLALVRAIQPQGQRPQGVATRIRKWFSKVTGRTDSEVSSWRSSR